MLARTLVCDVHVCSNLAARQPPVWVSGIGRRPLNYNFGSGPWTEEGHETALGFVCGPDFGCVSLADAKQGPGQNTHDEAELKLPHWGCGHLYLAVCRLAFSIKPKNATG